MGAIPLVHGERLVGIATQTDMMQALLAVLKTSSGGPQTASMQLGGFAVTL